MSVRPEIITSEDRLVGLLRGRRQAMGHSHASLDDVIGWSEGYTSKIEAPHRTYGKRAIWGLTAALNDWLQGLGLALVLMDAADARRLCAESAAPEMTEACPRAYAGRGRGEGGLVTERRIRLGYIFRRAA